MEQESLPTEVILAHPRQIIGKIHLDWMPQPGHHLDVEGKSYTVLERHHHYQYKVGGYHLHKISVYVQIASHPTERSFVNGRWIIGDATCRYNARSEILRCAVNPEGSCEGCRFYEPL